MKKIKISMDVADQISLASLKDYRKYLKKELKEHKKNPDTFYVHPDDLVGNQRRIEALNLIIKDYGGE